MKLRTIYLLMAGALALLLIVYVLFFSNVDNADLSTIRQSARSQEGNFAFKVGEEEGEVIRELVTMMARTNPAVLAFKKAKLEELGAKLRSKVTTFEFLAFVFSDPTLAKEMKLLQESSIKYKRFIEGLHPKMLKEYEKEGFYLRAHHFATHLEIDHKEFSSLLNNCVTTAQSGDKSAFRPLVDYLIAAKAG